VDGAVDARRPRLAQPALRPFRTPFRASRYSRRGRSIAAGGRNRTGVDGFAGGVLFNANKPLVYLPSPLSTQSQIGLLGCSSATRRSRGTEFSSR